MKEKLKMAISAALESAGLSGVEVSLEHPAELKNGDYSTGVALQYAKQAGMAPRALAEKIVASLGQIEGVAKTEIAGPGFINFYLAPAALAEAVETAGKEDMWGSNKNLAGKKIMVEYTDPNPFKEFHIGHLMSNAIGEAICRLFEFSGAEIKRAIYQGDVGLHVAKTIYAYKKYPSTEENEIIKWGLAYKIGNQAYESNEEEKKEIEDINRRIYEHDKGLSDLYNRGRKVSLDYFETVYGKLGM